MNRKMEILKFLDILSKLNPNIQFYYSTRKREIVADNTSFFVPNTTKSITDIKLPENSKYVFNNLMDNEGIRISANSEMIADLRVSNILSKEKSETRDLYTAYTPNKIRDAVTSISGKVNETIDSITRTSKPKRNESAFGQLVREAQEQDKNEKVDNSMGEPFMYTSEKPMTKNEGISLSEMFEIQEAKNRIPGNGILMKDYQAQKEKASVKLAYGYSTEQYQTLAEMLKKSKDTSSVDFPPVRNVKSTDKNNALLVDPNEIRKYIDSVNSSYTSKVYLKSPADQLFKTNTSSSKLASVKINPVVSLWSKPTPKIRIIDTPVKPNTTEANTTTDVNTTTKVNTTEAKRSTLGLAISYFFDKSKKVEKDETVIEKEPKKTVNKPLSVKLSDKFSNAKNSIIYFFDESKKVAKEMTVIGKGPKKIVKRPLRVKLSDKFSNAKNSIIYFFDESKKVAKEMTVIGKGPKKIVKRPLRVKLSDKFNNAKNSIIYFFDKSKKVNKNDSTNNNNNNGGKPVEPPKSTPIPPKPVEPPKPIEPPKDKRYELIEKEYILKCKEAYANLGEFEKMFVDDAKAECLNPKDEEFRLMLNERCVNKVQVMNYYETINNYKIELNNRKLELAKNKIKEAYKINEEDILYLYVSLGDFERMFVDDAIAENITLGDFEYNLMLSERCVNKDGVNKFMKAYKEYIVKQKELVSNYTKLTTQKDLKVLTINELRSLAKQYKEHFSEDELAKYKVSKLKKPELISIINRVEDNKSKELIKAYK